jgi:trans-2-enoyl-CoA reductase
VVYIGAVYACFKGTEYEYVDVYHRMLNSRQQTLYKKNNFDFDNYKKLQERMTELKKEIQESKTHYWGN